MTEPETYIDNGFIHLGKIKVRDKRQILSSVKKIYELLLSLSYNSYEATLMASLFSQLTKYIIRQENDINIQLGIQERESPYFFIQFLLPKEVDIQAISELNTVFDQVKESATEYNVPFIILDKKLHNTKAYLEKEFVAEVVQKVEISSQEELYEELVLSNEKLESILDELKQTQTQLVQSEKMASLGQLSAGIAHEINNPMNFVSVGTAILVRDVQDVLQLLNKYQKLGKNQKSESVLDEINELQNQLDIDVLKKGITETMVDIKLGLSRSAEIINGLRNFSRPDEEAKTLADIHEGLDSTLTLLQHELKNKVTVIKGYDDSIEKIPCYASQLNQVFMNILRNAIDAINDKGEIIIKTKRREANVEISIKDNGTGMSEEVKTKIFDPFFTTKEVGKGTGLGLAISYGIIEKHGGTIEVNSKEGQGSEFVITLPISSS